ncbi:hypothetical protein COCON_G00044030 [Conger conger]|uniref:Neuronal PAS domain-containing protein 4 n=1 Tax=Conger conger TaxID=82655 RepID=A0A9Q1DUC8_CONCO|nr:hypothetical protein COCON_G00044030 [Conger conger]
MYRSTKGASKARRDQINAEIRNLKDLLPISDADKARLSYLHIMSLACMYTRKSVFFSQEATMAGCHEESAKYLSFQDLSEVVQDMPGFLLLLTGEGKLLYLSDSVTEHLGHSMVDLVAQGDSVYDIIDPTDHFVMRSNLVPLTSPDTERLFRCRFNTSKSVRRQSAGNKLVLIRARCLSPPFPASSPASYWTSNPVWVCFCSPLEPHPPQPLPMGESVLTPPPDRTFFLACFHSQHSRDMRLQEAQDSVSVYLGFDVAALRSRSWYSLLHPQDLSHASAQHCSLLREGGEGRVEMVVRVESADSSWVWLYMVLQLEAGKHPISSHNYVISESEAWSVRQQLCSEQTKLTLALSSLQSPDTLSSPDQVFTPSSSGLSGQSFDFSVSVCGTGSSEELGGAAGESSRMEGDPRSSLSSLEEESLFQQQPAGPAPSPASSTSSTPVTVATVSDLDFLTQNIFLPPSFPLDPPLPSLPLPLPPISASNPQQGKEIVCTPPYTPQLGGGSFLFGEPLFSLDRSGTTSPSQPGMAMAPTDSPPAPAVTTAGSPAPMTQSTLLPLTLSPPSSELLFPGEPCGAGLYEKLPPTPDSPGDGDCTVMTLPEVRGPLYVDVPLGPLPYPPEGLLTPEASPGKQSGMAFFSLEREREKERAEISLLVQHLSSLAEGFYPDPLLPKFSPSVVSSSPSSPSLSPSLPAAEPAVEPAPMMDDFYTIKPWRGLDLPLLPDDISLFEESLLETLLQDLSTSASSTPSPCPSSPPPPAPALPPPRCTGTPPSHTEGGSAVGLSHFCSVQSAHCNCAAGGGLTAGGGVGVAGAGLAEAGGMEMDMEVEVSSSCSIPESPSAHNRLPESSPAAALGPSAPPPP